MAKIEILEPARLYHSRSEDHFLSLFFMANKLRLPRISTLYVGRETQTRVLT